MFAVTICMILLKTDNSFPKLTLFVVYVAILTISVNGNVDHPRVCLPNILNGETGSLSFSNPLGCDHNPSAERVLAVCGALA